MLKSPLFYFAVFCLHACAATEQWKNLHVTWSILGGYYELPLTIEAAKKAGFVYMIHDAYLKVNLYSYNGDPRLSILYDSYGNIGGLRTGYIKTDVVSKAESNNLTFPDYFSDKKMYGSTVYWGVDVWTNTVLFTSPDTLKAGGRNDTGGLVADDVYVKLGGTWTLMPKKSDDALALNFTKQGCWPTIGTHYFHGMTDSADCNELQGVFLIYSGSDMIGLGLAPWGSFTEGTKDWFEYITAVESEIIIPDAPSCVADYINNYGVSLIHIFFKKHPRLTLCPL